MWEEEGVVGSAEHLAAPRVTPPGASSVLCFEIDDQRPVFVLNVLYVLHSLNSRYRLIINTEEAWQFL